MAPACMLPVVAWCFVNIPNKRVIFFCCSSIWWSSFPTQPVCGHWRSKGSVADGRFVHPGDNFQSHPRAFDRVEYPRLSTHTWRSEAVRKFGTEVYIAWVEQQRIWPYD